MDDLSSLDWSKPAGGSQPPPPSSSSPYASLRPTPSPFASGRNTPASLQGPAGSMPKPAASKTAQDSFSNLVNFGSAKATQNMTLAQRQAQLEAERQQKEADRRRQLETQFGNAQQWDALESRGFTSSPNFQQPAASNGTKIDNDDDDIFAAFNKDTKVDKASHYPPPESSRSTPVEAAKLDLGKPESWNQDMGSKGASSQLEDDDPFGLSQLKPSAVPYAVSGDAADADDFLGDLGRPVDEVRNKRRQTAQPEAGKPIEDGDSSSSDDYRQARQQSKAPRRPESRTRDAHDKALAQLIDYGFSPEDARRALMESGSGPNAQAAANWLLDEAHRKAKQKSLAKNSAGSSRDASQSRQRGAEEVDFSKSAAAVGTSFFKTANSLWKTGQKKMQQAVAEFQQEGDASQPKWMRDAQAHSRQESRPAKSNVTDEALALEVGAGRKTSRATSRQPAEANLASGAQQARPCSNSPLGAHGRDSPAPRWQQPQRPSRAVAESRSRLDRLAADDDSFSSHVTAHRGRRPAAPPKPSNDKAEADILFHAQASGPSRPLPQRPAPSSESSPATRPRATPRPVRHVPPLDSAALQTSTRHRLEGTAHFKRGDYATAHSSYSLSMSRIPTQHPLMIVLLTNRALTALKTGEPKQAVQDADEALKLIGPGKGTGENVAVKSESGQDEDRDMKELYGKALSRKAEALEQMERWTDAGAIWHSCVEDGVGGATAVKGRQRCQHAVAPKPQPAARPAAKPRPKPSAAASLAPQKSSEAVTRLREANKAAAKEDDEKFVLSEKVDARVAAWRDGKRDNLRALLGSLDKVLWENSGWKGVGMHELVMANKVKVVYMKAIAKTHPDKLPQDASTEVRLIAGLVFSTLNEGWDKFKAENGL
ncbi:hypothetical protein CDD81_3815 [Ophiocordyceps australis]|uniref:UBA domain-containing protein n=1 Tax=Ophiocordyceps australis TaxID=1399860 RepID=A0A2C5XVH2_9HYPO|nr:hypothetical protein CDD81_3815 [Ophiocordyceps australis]